MEKNKMRFFKQTVAIMVLAALTFMAGCGGSSNDQGVTFTALGFFQVTEEDGALEINPDVIISGIGTVMGAQSARVAIGLQNNLCCQFIRTERVQFSYEIPGVGVRPPDTAVTIGGIIRPTPGGVVEDGDGAGSQSSLPDGFITGEASINYYTLRPVRTEIGEWLLFNKNQLPATPFDMIVTATATGVTSAGNRLQTNPISLAVTVVE